MWTNPYIITRPQRSCGHGYVFTHASAFSLTGGVNPENPPGPRRTPPVPVQPPPWPSITPLGQGEPPLDHGTPVPPPPVATRNSLDQGEPPPMSEHCSIRSVSGRYAMPIWTAFLSVVQAASQPGISLAKYNRLIRFVQPPCSIMGSVHICPQHYETLWSWCQGNPCSRVAMH